MCCLVFFAPLRLARLMLSLPALGTPLFENRAISLFYAIVRSNQQVAIAMDPIAVEHLKDIESSIAKIDRFLVGKSFQDLSSSDLMRDAVLRNLEIISEASRHVDDGFKASSPEVLWSDWVELRDQLVHAYYEIDDRTLWNTVRDGLPVLAAAVKRLQAR